MIATRADAGRGWGWIAEGWQLFIKAPGIWLVIMLIYFAISMVLSFIPFVGTLAYVLLSPVLTAGMIYGAAMLDRGQALEIGHLFQGFRDQERMGPLVVLGLFSLASGVLMALVMFVFMGGGLLLGGTLDSTGAIIPSEAMGSVFVGAGLLAFLLVLAIGILIGMALFYSVPLVMLAGQNAWPAVQDSLAACWINIVPLLVFGLLAMLLGFVAAIPFGLGILVFVPVMMGAIYASYREVFGGNAPAAVNLRK